MPAKKCVFKGPKNQTLSLTDNKHNRLQKAVIELFRPRYAKGSSLVYQKHSLKNKPFCNKEALSKIGVKTSNAKNWPGIILLDKKKKWLFLIQLITSKKLTLQRQAFKLKKMFAGCSFDLILINAFSAYDDMNKYMIEPAWGTTTWMVEVPDHTTHFNGNRFLGPY
jgi:hypothetical protein